MPSHASHGTETSSHRLTSPTGSWVVSGSSAAGSFLQPTEEGELALIGAAATKAVVGRVWWPTSSRAVEP